MRLTIACGVVMLVVSAPAFAQVPVYTNADLGKPTPRHVITPAEYQSLLAHQFVCACGVPRDDRGGGRVGIATWTPPTAEAMKRPTYPLQPPFFMSTYVGPTIGVFPLGRPPDPHQR